MAEVHRRSRSILAALGLFAASATVGALAGREAPPIAYAQENETRAPSTSAPRPTPAPTFDPAVVIAAPTVQRARALIEAEEYARARTLLDAARSSADERAPADELAWLAARAAYRAGDQAAADTYLATIDEDAPLGRWARLQRAHGAAPEEALSLLAPLVGPRWGGQEDARLLHARTLARLERWDEAAPELRALVAEAPDRRGAAGAALPLADHLAASESEEERLEALALYRRVATRGPRAELGREAAAKAERVLASLPPLRRAEVRVASVEDRLAEARALASAQLHVRAANAYRAVRRGLLAGAEGWCRAAMGEARALLDARERADAATLLVEVAERCPDERVEARFRAGRALHRTGQYEEAREQLEALQREAPEHRLADDASYRVAMIYESQGQSELRAQTLRELPARYPSGDMRAEALFQLGLGERLAGRPAAALPYFERGALVGETERLEGIDGRARYWLGRTLEDLGRGPEAVDAYRTCAREFPLAYYAQLSLGRLAALDPATREEIERAWRMSPREIVFPTHPVLEEGPFRAALALLRVGDFDRAEDELAAVGAIGAGADEGVLWMVAALYERAGDHPRAARLVRRRLDTFRGFGPGGQGHAYWRLAYPRAFAPLVEEKAREVSVDASLLRALAREESSFDPTARSPAHAYGLVQVILPTARQFGAGLETRIDARSMMRPEINLAVGARYLSFLGERFDPALVPAAYNAGHTAVGRWRQRERDQDVATFIESITYAETRRYTRRVLQTWGVYAFLDGGELTPFLPAPPDTIELAPPG